MATAKKTVAKKPATKKVAETPSTKKAAPATGPAAKKPSTGAPAKKTATRTAAQKQHAGSEAPPWERENPKDASGEPHQHLTPQQKASAKRAAKKAGRPYPNLVDNLHELQKAKKEEKS